MKSKLYALSILSMFAFMSAAHATLSTEAILDLTGSVTEQLAIDIDSPTGTGSACQAGNHECNSDLGELTNAIADTIVAKVGVLSNNGYQIFMYSDNGGMQGQVVGVNDSYNDPYSLGWENVGAAQTVGAGVGAKAGMLATPKALGTYECSLDAGCPGTPTARHEIHLTKAANPSLGAGAYADKVHFIIENANGT